MKIKSLSIIMLLVLSFFCSCSKEIDENESKVTLESSVTTVSEELVQENSTVVGTDESAESVIEETPISNIQNPITGELGFNENAINKRPVAVMINNIQSSLPQYGIEAADMIYEIVVEGGITRMMAIYSDYSNVPNVCSIRSCRFYFPILAYGMDAIYCHWGTDKTMAQETLDRLGIERFDGGGNAENVLFFNDQDRLNNYAREHTGYLKGSVLPELIQSYGYRTDLLEKNRGNVFNFNSENDMLIPSGVDCNKVLLNFSSDYFSTFDFDSELKVYKKQHSGSAHMDQSTGNQLSFTNVFALRTQIGLLNIGQLMDVKLNGGTGYYISNGKAQEINWHKNSEEDKISFTDLDGNELIVNKGKSYIGIIGNEKIISIN